MENLKFQNLLMKYKGPFTLAATPMQWSVAPNVKGKQLKVCLYIYIYVSDRWLYT